MKTQINTIAREISIFKPMGDVDEKPSTEAKQVDSFVSERPSQKATYLSPSTDTAMIKDFLGGAPQSIRCLGGGDNDVFLVNNEWIFRFPKYESARQANVREQILLQKLSHQIQHTAIPRYEFWNEGKGVGAYRQIRGHNLSRALLQGLTTKERKYLAQDLAGVLTELHRFPLAKVDVTLAQGVTKERRRLETLKVLGELRMPFREEENAMVREACSLVEEHFSSTTRATVLLHGDLHCDNIIFDTSTNSLAGIIDFSDAVEGPAILDLVGLYRASPTLADDVQHYYAENMGLDEAQLKRDCRALALTIFAREILMNSNEQSAQGMRRLSRAGYVVTSIFENGWTGTFNS